MADLGRLKTALQDRYVIERELGAGGMATVYLAEDLKLHRKVALKVLRPELASALGPDRFLQEIDIAAKLNHPHILGLFDCGETDGFLYYVMPYIEGESLREKLAKESELPIPEAVRILRDVVEALSHAHKHNVVHRDIKPDNILLSERHALVTDFGVAKAISDATGAIGLTTEGVALGTPAYMSPEQASADPHIDHRADIYGLGTIAYELLAGRTPFVGNTQQELLAAHVTQTPEPVTKYRESVPPALAALVMKCLEKKAADRWQTAEELLPQLEALATPSGGVTPTGMMPVDRKARRKWMMTGGAVATAAIIAVIVMVASLPRGSSVALDPDHVVVAVFRNATRDPSLDLLGERIGHWITQGLQRAAIPVTPWDLALQSSDYVRAEAEAGRVREWSRALAEETGAGIVVSGAVYVTEGDSLEVQLNVTDVLRGRSLGTIDPLRVPRTSVNEVITNAQQRVMIFLAPRFEERFQDYVLTEGIAAAPTFDAYDAFREGQRSHMDRNWGEAVVHFRRAFEADSSWPLPLFRMVLALANMGKAGSAESDSMLMVLRGFWNELTPYQRSVLQYIRASKEGDGEQAMGALRSAAELAPGSPSVYNLARMLQLGNRPREAVDVLSTLDPEHGWVRDWAAYWMVLTASLNMLGEHERELSAARRAYRLFPDEGAFVLWLQARALAELGRFEEIESILSEMEIAEDIAWVRIGFIRTVETLRANGHVEEAKQVSERAVRWFEARPPNERAEVGHREWYGRALFLAGRQADGKNVLDALVDEYPDGPQRARATRAVIAVTLGDTVQARSDAVWFENREQADWNTSKARVAIAAALGDKEGAMRVLRESNTGWAFFGDDRTDVLFESLRDYPPWQEFLRPKG